jgi:hypothetical protein
VPVYIAEISPQNMRGALGSVNQVTLLHRNNLFDTKTIAFLCFSCLF